MTWPALVHVVISGLATGSIYALMAISLVIIYNATRTLNFAQGEMLMVSTFVGWTAWQVLQAPLVVALSSRSSRPRCSASSSSASSSVTRSRRPTSTC